MHLIGPLGYLKYAPVLLAKRELYHRMRKKFYHPWRDSAVVRDFSRQIGRRLNELDVDAVLSPLSAGSQPIAYLDCKQPIVVWTDTTWAAVVDFYPDFDSSTICGETLRDAIANERAALSRAALVIYWSDWAAQSAIRFYDLDPKKVRVIPPGPCFAGKISYAEARRIVRSRSKDTCRLLFVGEHWVRKGGDLAVEVAKRLNAAGLRAELILVGCRPPSKLPVPDCVRVLGYMNRATPEGARRFNELLRSSHFLLVPSRAEAFGLVFAEANAFALPSITTDVGGIPTVVRSGVNGTTLPLSADATQYCAFVEETFAHYKRYEQLALAAFTEFETRINNRIAATAVARAIEELL